MPGSVTSRSTDCESLTRARSVSWNRIESFHAMIQLIENDDFFELYSGWYYGPRFLNNEFELYLLPALVSISAETEHIQFFRKIAQSPDWFEWTVPRVRLARDHCLWLASKFDSLTVSEELYFAIESIFGDIFNPTVTANLAASSPTYSGPRPPSFIDWLKKISNPPSCSVSGESMINSIVHYALASANREDLLDAITSESESSFIHNVGISPDLISFADVRSYALCYDHHPRAVLYLFKLFRDSYHEFEKDDCRLANERIVINYSTSWRYLNRIDMVLERYESEWFGTIGHFLAKLYQVNRDYKRHKDCYMNCVFSQIDAEDIMANMDRDGLDCGSLYEILRGIDDQVIIDIYTSVTDAITNRDLKFPTTNVDESVCSLILMRRAISSGTAYWLRAQAAEAAEATG